MKIGYLGTGSWGFCLAALLAGKGHLVTSWTTNAELAKKLTETGVHPLFPDIKAPESIVFTTSLEETINGADMIVESVTTRGLRPVLLTVKGFNHDPCPFVITSKGIEIETGMILPDVAVEILGEQLEAVYRHDQRPQFCRRNHQGAAGLDCGNGF